jgi:23S rRNA pseudoU1915 N3-methylase RlmH
MSARKEIREGEATSAEKEALKSLRDKDIAATVKQRISASNTLRSKKPVTLAGKKVEETKNKISFVDEKTGEVFEMPKDKYDKMTPNQRIQELKNMEARSNIAEDLSDEAMAKRKKQLAAAAAARKKSAGGSMGKKTIKRAIGGSMGSKPKGVGCAQKGYGRAMKK